MKRIRHILEAVAAYLAFGLFRLLPMEMASAAGGALARMIGPLTRAHATARRNLVRALPALTERDRRRVLSDSWDNFGRVMTEYAVLSRLSAHHDSRVEIVGAEHIQALAGKNEPAFMVSAHIGNWEVTALAVAWISAPPVLIYRAPNNPLIAGLLNRARGHANTDLVPKGAGGARDILRYIKDARIIEIAADQKMNTGIAVPFFGRSAMTGDAIARLALRHNCAIVAGRSERLPGCRFRVTFEAPWTPVETGDPESDIQTTLAQINQTFERWITETPGQWLWQHNRWPKDESEG